MSGNNTAEYIHRRREEMVRDLCDFVAIESVSDDREKIDEALKFILALAAGKGMKAAKAAGGRVAVIEMGEGPETLGILTHLDVVPPGDLSLWDSEPFKPRVADGKITGRGTLDDKGMVIAVLCAMEAVKNSGLPLKKKVQHIIGTQEEVEWTDMAAYIAEQPLPDYGFTPDGEYPICNIEKGVMDVSMEFDVADGTGLSAGPAVSRIQAGTAKNIVPAMARAWLSNGEEIEAAGRAVHSCQPEKGANAIFVLADKLNSREALADNKLHRLLNSIKDVFEDTTGDKLGLGCDNEYYQGEYVHKNSFSPTMFEAWEGKATLNVNVRFPYGQSPEGIAAGLEEYAVSQGGRLTGVQTLPAVFVSRERPFLKALAEAYEKLTGLENEFSLAYGGSYAKAMPNVVSWGPIFPGEEDSCHEPNEFITIDSFVKNTEIFAEAIYRIAGSEKSFK